MTPTAIAAVVLRRPTVLVGRVVAVAAYVRPWVRFHVELSDGTGSITLRFMGRTEIAASSPTFVCAWKGPRQWRARS